MHFLLYELSRHENIQEEIYREISTNCPKNEAITESMLNKMRLLKATLKESLRLHNVGIVNSRKPKVDLTFDNYVIPKYVRS